MPAKVGDKLPELQLDELVDGSPTKVSLTEVFKGKKGVLFGVPGAFTPGCSKTHLPGYVADFDKLKEAGAEVIVCVAVNDAFVMGAWGEAHGAPGKVRMLADTNGELTRALDIELPAFKDVLGRVPMRRFSAVVEDGVVKTFNLEEGGELTCSLANQIIGQLKQFFVERPQDPGGSSGGEEMFDHRRRHFGF